MENKKEGTKPYEDCKHCEFKGNRMVALGCALKSVAAATNSKEIKSCKTIKKPPAVSETPLTA